MKSPILVQLVNQGYPIEAGPTGCTVPKGDRVDVEKNSLWVDVKACTTAEGARNADARLVATVVSELPVEPSSSSGPTTPSFFQTARAPRGSSAEHLDSSSPVEDNNVIHVNHVIHVT